MVPRLAGNAEENGQEQIHFDEEPTQVEGLQQHKNIRYHGLRLTISHDEQHTHLGFQLSCSDRD